MNRATRSTSDNTTHQGGRVNLRRSAYRRTKLTALAVSATALLVAVATEPGAAAPSETPFRNGTGSATALGYKVNPTNGNLSFGITVGEAISGHQNTGAIGQSRAINLGVIGVTLAGEACDGGAATMPEEDQPQPVIARSGEKGADEGFTEMEQGVPSGIEKHARATTAPYAEAITTIAPLGDPAAIYVSGGRTITHSGVIGGNTREAYARTELGTISLGGGTVKIEGMTWEAIQRTGAVEDSVKNFSMGTVSIGGQVVPLAGDGFEQAAALNEALAPLGFIVTPPVPRFEQNIAFVDPLKIGVIPSAQRDGLLQPVISGAQPLREQIVDALLEQDCGNSTYVTVADIVLGSVTGAGALSLELGGVQATTADFQLFPFGALGKPAALPPVAGLSSPPAVNVPTVRPSVAAPTAAPAPAPTAAPEAEDTIVPEPIADIVGERGGAMALIGGGGLLLLLATAEADRRKMQHALRQIPLEV